MTWPAVAQNALTIDMPEGNTAEVWFAQTLSVGRTPGTVMVNAVPEFAGMDPPPGTVTNVVMPMAANE